MNALTARRSPVAPFALLMILVLGVLATFILGGLPADGLPLYWIGLGLLCGFVFYVALGEILTGVFVWFLCLICLHEEFWRQNVPGFFALTVPRILLAVLLVAFVGMRAIGRFRLRWAWPVSAVILAIALYFTVSATVSGFETRSPVTVHYRLIGGYLFPFAAFILVLHGLNRERDFHRIAVFFAVLSVYLTYTGWCEQFKLFGLVWPSFIGDPSVGIHWERVRGPFVLAPAMGLALTYCFFSNLVLARHSAYATRWLLLALNTLMLPAIFWTKTRSVWLAFLMCSLIWILYARSRMTRIVSVSFLTAMTLFVAVVNMDNFLSEHRGKGGLTDVEPILLRIGLAQMSFQMVRDHPLTGVGFGHFRDHATDYARDPSSPFFAFTSSAMEHNNLLSIVAETGLVGLTLYVMLIAMLLRASIRLFRWLPESAAGFINRDLLVLYWILAAAFIIDGLFRETSDNPFANSLFLGLSGVVVALDWLLSPQVICRTAGRTGGNGRRILSPS